MPVAAHNPAGPLKRRVRTPRLVIIELVLEDIRPATTSGTMLYQSAMDFYRGIESRIHHVLVSFNIHPDNMSKHGLVMQELTKRLQEWSVYFHNLFRFGSNLPCSNFDHMIFIVHTHSDDDRGDLWFYKGSEGTAAEVTQARILLSPVILY
jgi:hypothetical protein